MATNCLKILAIFPTTLQPANTRVQVGVEQRWSLLSQQQLDWKLLQAWDVDCRHRLQCCRRSAWLDATIASFRQVWDRPCHWGRAESAADCLVWCMQWSQSAVLQATRSLLHSDVQTFFRLSRLLYQTTVDTVHCTLELLGIDQATNCT